MRVNDALAIVPEMDKKVWMANTRGQGALLLANLKTFRLLNEELGIERTFLGSQDSTKNSNRLV